MDEYHSNKQSRENSYIEPSSDEHLALGFDPISNTSSRSLFYVLKCFLLKLILHGVDGVMIKNRRASKTGFDLSSDGIGLEDRKIEEQYVMEFPKSGKNNNNNHTNISSNIPSHVNIPAFIVAMTMRVIGFQLSLFFRFLTFPIWSSYFLFTLFFFPLRTTSRVTDYLLNTASRVRTVAFTAVTSSVSKRARAQKPRAARFGCAVFSSVYACFVLVGLLALGFLIGGFMVRYLIVEKPIQFRENLNFDYSKSSPVAFVPLKHVSAGAKSPEIGRVVPHNHKLHVSVLLTAPESDYNHKLGVFQVRVDFLSGSGKALGTSGQPCMLRFKSGPIRFVETLLNSIPVIAGLRSESQILNIKMPVFSEGIEPTTCLRVILEQRAEFGSGQGAPQIYEASLLLESELPKFKKFVWLWRRTIFVWSSIMAFLTMLTFILIFIRPFLFPIRPIKDGSLAKKKMSIWS